MTGGREDSAKYQVLVAPIASPAATDISHLARRLSETFGFLVSSVTPTLNWGKAWMDSRHQYDSTELLKELERVCPVDRAKIVAVTDIDLCNPVLDFVFGEAQVDGAVAIVSTHRLRSSFYGMPEDLDAFHERLTKIAVHELGHLLGIRHCEYPACVMCPAKSVEELDPRNAWFCPLCRWRLRTMWRLNSMEGWIAQREWSGESLDEPAPPLHWSS